MRAFISYSFSEHEKYVASLLVTELRNNGYSVVSGEFGFDSRYQLSYQTKSKIQTSQFFVGIITKDSLYDKKVSREWKFAKETNIPRILLVESGVILKGISANQNVIYFDRKNPQRAIDKIFGLAENKKSSPNSASDVLVGVGIVAGIAALIALLAGGDKK